MKISTLKELEAVIKLCRKTGVESIVVDGVQLKLGDAPSKQAKPGTETSENKQPQDELSDDDMLFWSSAQV